MKPQELRTAQAPLKECYRQHPEKAVVRFKARGELLPNRIACRVQTHAGEIVSALHPAAGGDEDSACSADMLLQSLVACMGVTLCAVAASMGIHLESGSIEAQADYDFRGTLGIDRQVPVGIRRIELRLALHSDATEDQRRKLLEVAERYCVIYQTLCHPPEVHLIVQ